MRIANTMGVLWCIPQINLTVQALVSNVSKHNMISNNIIIRAIIS